VRAEHVFVLLVSGLAAATVSSSPLFCPYFTTHLLHVVGVGRPMVGRHERKAWVDCSIMWEGAAAAVSRCAAVQSIGLPTLWGSRSLFVCKLHAFKLVICMASMATAAPPLAISTGQFACAPLHFFSTVAYSSRQGHTDMVHTRSIGVGSSRQQ
jgi:hypothetical protein